MTKDLDGFASLPTEYTDLLADWVRVLRAEFPAVLAWWSDLGSRLNRDGRDVAHLHWPAGPVSHPRVLCLFREFYFRARDVNLRASEQAADERPARDLWLDADEGESGAGPIAERVLLLDMMQDYAPDLWEHFQMLDFLPIGEDADFNPC